MIARFKRRPVGAAAPSPGDESVASIALRASALLRGAVPGTRVWQVLGEEAHASVETARIAQLRSSGHDPVAAMISLGGEEWRVLAAAWRLAERSGAPLTMVLERFAGALQSLERLAERRSVLLAGPRATIRLVSVLPILALLLGWALGFDPARVLFSPLGAVLAALGGLLLLIGTSWAHRLIARLAAADWVAGIECELVWVALAGGATPASALRRVADSAVETRAAWVKLASMCRGGSVMVVLETASRLGTPVGAMLLAEAEAARTRALAALEREAERLGVRVLLPIGLCVLPSFIVLGVLPVILAVLGTVAW